MSKAYGILGVLLLVGCSSTNYLSSGPEVEAEVQQALDATDRGEAALATGRAHYWMYGKSLAAERSELIAALRAAPYVRPEDFTGLPAHVPRNVEVIFNDEDLVVAWVRSEVFEVRCPTGTLHVERVEWPSDSAPSFRISLIQEKKVLYAGGKDKPRIDRAWRRLAAAARRGSTVELEGSQSMDRPLSDLRRLGVDFRGISR